jgi:2-keto-4-pentenoate hydratase/2-oxohepta-3-ene-1,7-dioic acid hydratase in catechol pathway
MRIANVLGRSALIVDGQAVDVEEASEGQFGSNMSRIYERWPDFRRWAEQLNATSGTPIDPSQLGPPSPAPRQVFAVGLNYRDHTTESGFEQPDSPVICAKFPSCIAGPEGELGLPSENVDWEIELVAVIGTEARRVPVSAAWDHVAGLTVGQDYSERRIQHAGPVPQFSLGKSFPGFGATGPYLVTPDEFDDPDDLVLQCTLNGEQVQKGRTSAMIFSLPELISRISAVCPLLPGDLIFSGTPDGVGMARVPPRFLREGDVVVSHIEGIGALRNVCRAAEE